MHNMTEEERRAELRNNPRIVTNKHVQVFTEVLPQRSLLLGKHKHMNMYRMEGNFGVGKLW